MKTLDKTFGVRVKDILEKHEIKQKDLAADCGINISSLNKILNAGRESDFRKILALIQKIILMDGNLQEEEFMSYYIREIQNPMNIKPAMEYCDTHDMRETLEMLCERADYKADHKNRLKEFSTMYRLNMERKDQQDEKYVSKELFNKVISQNNKTKEMKIFQLILELENYHQERNFYKLIASLPKLKNQLDQSENNFQTPSFKMRFNKLLQTIYLRNICDFKKARELANEALDLSIGKRFDAASYVNLGDSHIHDADPTQAIRYLEKSIKLYNDIGLDFAAKMMRNKIEFISILRGREIDCIKIEQNVALKYIINGQKEAALKILDKLDITPERLYMKGVATDDPSYFWKSLDGFMKRGDRLYGLFTVQELKRLGERADTIDMVYNNIEEVKHS
ncbi:AimR family lysis-lysogeny pheromone receptor [Jeotgalibacillus marinus]|uniref:AimR family lysis-lysogeny pheromone receptor n=1 Tax=Jeotgalibacillus marinus TaxID=86667 RepID=A0ABV3Q5A4_9BACL